MKYLKALHAAAKGILQGFNHSLGLHRKEMESLRRMEIAQRKAMGTLRITTALMKDMEDNARLARKIEHDANRRFEQ